jgi:polyribonucleotide nucleotidyltransferase
LKAEYNVAEGEELDANIKKQAKNFYHDLQYHVVRNMILNDRVRLDGRGMEDVRPLSMETDILPSPHGSALFTRGKRNHLHTVTLGTPLMN